MWVRWLPVLAVLAACRFGFDPVAPPCSEGPCLDGGGEVFEDAMVDAPRGDPSSDTDGDTVTDDVDNCISVINLAQYDEDADGYGDVCDNCPTVPNTNQANVGETNAGQAADNVGDACDPRPAQSGESITYFDPFTAATLATDWTVMSGTWTVSSGAVEQASLLSDQRIHDPAAAPGPNYVVESRITFTGFDVANVNGGIVFRMTNGNGWLCSVFHDDITSPATSLLMMWSLQSGAANFERNRIVIPEVKVGSSYRLIAGAFGSNLYCAIDSFQTGPTAPFTSNQNNSGVPGMRTNRVTGTYSNFVVYTLGGAI
jgi:hypothetical protein